MPRFVRNFWIEATVYDGLSKVRKWASGPRVRERGDARIEIRVRDRGDVRKALTVEMIEYEGQNQIVVTDPEGEVLYQRIYLSEPDPKPRLAEKDDGIGAWI